MRLPPTDEQGRFVVQHRDAKILARLFAKTIDLVMLAIVTMFLAWPLQMPWPVVVSALLLCLADVVGSPGKWLLRLRVITLDEAPVTIIGAIKRNFLLVLPFVGQATIGLIDQTPTAQNWDRVIVFCLTIAIFIAEAVGMLFHPQNRRWGDQFGQTRVVDR